MHLLTDMSDSSVERASCPDDECAAVDTPTNPSRSRAAAMDHLDQLEAQSIYIFREAFARLKKLALLWSLGKDSNVMIWLARKAFFGKVPFPALHVDTGKKFPEMYAFRERFAKGMEPRSQGGLLPADRRGRSDAAAGGALRRAQDRGPQDWRSPSTASTA